MFRLSLEASPDILKQYSCNIGSKGKKFTYLGAVLQQLYNLSDLTSDCTWNLPSKIAVLVYKNDNHKPRLTKSDKLGRCYKRYTAHYWPFKNTFSNGQPVRFTWSFWDIKIMDAPVHVG